MDVWLRIADGLHIPGHLLRLGPRPWEDEEDSVKRRAFMSLGSKVAAAGLVGMSGVPAPVNGNRIGRSSTTELEREISRLRNLDQTIGGRDLYLLYKPMAERLRKMLTEQTYSGLTKHDLLTLYSEHLQQTGWAAFDSGEHEEARALYHASFDSAQECRNAELAANAMAFRSYQLVNLGEDGTQLTARSIALAERGGRPGTQALLLQRGAWSYAVAGDPDTTAELLGRAENAISAADINDTPEWAAWANNGVEQDIMTGRCWAQLGRPLRSVPALQRAMSKYGDHHARDKSLYLTWLADAYIDAGEPVEAAVTTAQAFDLAETAASVRPYERITAVQSRLAEHSSMPEVAELLDRCAAHPLQVGRQTGS